MRFAPLVAIFVPALALAQTIVGTTTPRHAVDIRTAVQVSLAISGNVNPSPRDYMVLVPTGIQLGKEFEGENQWKYLNDKAPIRAGDTSARPAAGMTDGIVTFLLAKPGSYEARLYRRPILDTAPAVHLKTFPIVAKFTEIQINGYPDCTVNRQADRVVDTMSIVIENNKCSLIAADGNTVKLGDKGGATLP